MLWTFYLKLLLWTFRNASKKKGETIEVMNIEKVTNTLTDTSYDSIPEKFYRIDKNKNFKNY